MINALTAAPVTPPSRPAPAASVGDDHSMAPSFAHLLDQAGGDGRTAAPGSELAQSDSAAAAPAGVDETAAGPTEHAEAPASPGKGAAPRNQSKPIPRNAARGAAGPEAAAATPPTAPQPDRLDTLPRSDEGAAPGAARTSRAHADDASSVPAPVAAPQIPPAVITPKGLAAPAADAAATLAAAANRRLGAAAQPSGPDGSSAAKLQPAQGDVTTPVALSPRFGDAMRAVSVADLGAPAVRVGPETAQPPPLPTAALMPLAATAPASAAAAEATLAASPGSAAFASQLGAQVTTFVRNGLEHARLHLNPADMGPVTVQIRLDGDSANVHLAAEHALTRQALDQAMPLLASSLREAGLTLSGGGVFEQPRQGRDGGGAGTDQRHGGSPGRRGEGVDSGDRALSGLAPATPALRRRGVVDLVA